MAAEGTTSDKPSERKCLPLINLSERQTLHRDEAAYFESVLDSNKHRADEADAHVVIPARDPVENIKFDVLAVRLTSENNGEVLQRVYSEDLSTTHEKVHVFVQFLNDIENSKFKFSRVEMLSNHGRCVACTATYIAARSILFDRCTVVVHWCLCNVSVMRPERNTSKVLGRTCGGKDDTHIDPHRLGLHFHQRPPAWTMEHEPFLHWGFYLKKPFDDHHEVEIVRRLVKDFQKEPKKSGAREGKPKTVDCIKGLEDQQQQVQAGVSHLDLAPRDEASYRPSGKEVDLPWNDRTKHRGLKPDEVELLMSLRENPQRLPSVEILTVRLELHYSDDPVKLVYKTEMTTKDEGENARPDIHAIEQFLNDWQRIGDDREDFSRIEMLSTHEPCEECAATYTEQHRAGIWDCIPVMFWVCSESATPLFRTMCRGEQGTTLRRLLQRKNFKLKAPGDADYDDGRVEFLLADFQKQPEELVTAGEADMPITKTWRGLPVESTEELDEDLKNMESMATKGGPELKQYVPWKDPSKTGGLSDDEIKLLESNLPRVTDRIYRLGLVPQPTDDDGCFVTPTQGVDEDGLKGTLQTTYQATDKSPPAIRHYQGPTLDVLTPDMHAGLQKIDGIVFYRIDEDGEIVVYCDPATKATSEQALVKFHKANECSLHVIYHEHTETELFILPGPQRPGLNMQLYSPENKANDIWVAGLPVVVTNKDGEKSAAFMGCSHSIDKIPQDKRVTATKTKVGGMTNCRFTLPATHTFVASFSDESKAHVVDLGRNAVALYEPITSIDVSLIIFPQQHGLNFFRETTSSIMNETEVGQVRQAKRDSQCFRKLGPATGDTTGAVWGNATGYAFLIKSSSNDGKPFAAPGDSGSVSILEPNTDPQDSARKVFGLVARGSSDSVLLPGKHGQEVCPPLAIVYPYFRQIEALKEHFPDEVTDVRLAELVFETKYEYCP